MKIYRTLFHALITLASLAGFLVGWVTLAHARKPVPQGQSAQSAPVDLAPLPPIGSFNQDNGLQSFAPLMPQPRRFGGLVTRGS